MLPLDEKYYAKLSELSNQIQNSESLANYLEEEEDELYQVLRSEFEPSLSDLHHQVAAEAPLQLVTFEKYLIDPLFEGLYLPKVLGYSVLRGEITDQYKYVRPNDHFKDILLSICQSPHFDQLKKRIGQSIQTGFCLSSDIWITNLMSLVENKRIRYFLQQLKHDQSHDPKYRADLYNRYSNQFKNEMYFSAEFPSQIGEMKANFSALRQFLLKRFEKGGDNSSLSPKIKGFLDNKEFWGNDEYVEMLCIYGNFMEMSKAEMGDFVMNFARERKSFPEFDIKFLNFYLILQKTALGVGSATDEKMSVLVDKSYPDKITEFYTIADKVHSKGYVHPEVIDAVRTFYNEHEGVSIENECLRQVILNYITRLMGGFTYREYNDYFEITKIFALYIKIFSNQQFNQAVEKMSMKFIKSLMVRFTDKRSKDYQDVKKFVSTQFVDLKFLTDKEVIELFKTRRKRKSASEE
jgi:hypothetical protein